MESRNDNFQQGNAEDAIIAGQKSEEQKSNVEQKNSTESEIEKVSEEKEEPKESSVETIEETTNEDDSQVDLTAKEEFVSEEPETVLEETEQGNSTKPEIEKLSEEKEEPKESSVETIEETTNEDDSQVDLTAKEEFVSEEPETVLEETEQGNSTEPEIEKLSEEKEESKESSVETIEETNEDDSQVDLATEEEIVSEEPEIETTKAETDSESEKMFEAETEEEIAEGSINADKYHLQTELAMREENESEEIEISDDFFDHLNRWEVVKTLEEVVGETDVVKIKRQISLLKIRFLKLTKEEREERLQSFLANGGNKEDFDASPDEWDIRFNEVFDRYKANKAKYLEDLEQAKVTNLQKKRELLEELKQLIESSTDSLKQIYDRFREIQVMWKEIGAVPQANVAELWQNYHFYVEKFFDKVRINRELRDLDMKKNLERKLEICEKTEALLLETSIVRSFKLLQQYHKEWKESGAVEDDKREELWNRFKTASNKINQNRRDYYEQLDKQQNENYQAKLALCEKMEELANTEIISLKQMNGMNTQVTELFKTWGTIGAVPKDVYDAIWGRFRKSCNTFFANKRQFLSKMKEEQVDNYNLKLNLCIQAEAIVSRKDWKKATLEILDLQQEWKEIGVIKGYRSEALWKRFRKACDAFFTAKNEHYSDVQKHETENLQKKEDLIKRVKEYVFVGSKEEDFEALKAFQREWTTIGYTALSEKERLWNSFHEAISKRFDELKISVHEIDKAKYTDRINNMVTKTTQPDNVLEKERRFLQNKIKQLTDDAKLWENNLGFFAHSKNSEELKEQFTKKIEKAKQDVESLKAKLAILQESRKNKVAKVPENKNKEDQENKNKRKK
jgi:hypothetical protein